MRERTKRIRWGEGGGEVNRDAERDQDLYLSGLSENNEASWISDHSLPTIQFNKV